MLTSLFAGYFFSCLVLLHNCLSQAVNFVCSFRLPSYTLFVQTCLCVQRLCPRQSFSAFSDCLSKVSFTPEEHSMLFWSPWPGDHLFFFALLGFPCSLLCDLCPPPYRAPLSGRTHLAAAVGRSVSHDVVLDLSHGRQPGEEGTLPSDFTCSQVAWRIQNCKGGWAHREVQVLTHFPPSQPAQTCSPSQWVGI